MSHKAGRESHERVSLSLAKNQFYLWRGQPKEEQQSKATSSTVALPAGSRAPRAFFAVSAAKRAEERRRKSFAKLHNTHQRGDNKQAEWRKKVTRNAADFLSACALWASAGRAQSSLLMKTNLPKVSKRKRAPNGACVDLSAVRLPLGSV